MRSARRARHFGSNQSSIVIFQCPLGGSVGRLTQVEMEEDIAWASGRPTVRAVAGSSEGHHCQHEQALNPTETKSLQAYRTKSPTMAFSLSQNGATSFAMTSTESHLQTMIRHSGLTWCDGPLATGAGLFWDWVGLGLGWAWLGWVLSFAALQLCAVASDIRHQIIRQ